VCRARPSADSLLVLLVVLELEEDCAARQQLVQGLLEPDRLIEDEMLLFSLLRILGILNLILNTATRCVQGEGKSGLRHLDSPLNLKGGFKSKLRNWRITHTLRMHSARLAKLEQAGCLQTKYTATRGSLYTSQSLSPIFFTVMYTALTLRFC